MRKAHLEGRRLGGQTVLRRHRVPVGPPELAWVGGRLQEHGVLRLHADVEVVEVEGREQDGRRRDVRQSVS
mgnify:CR=1 FL=1